MSLARNAFVSCLILLSAVLLLLKITYSWLSGPIFHFEMNTIIIYMCNWLILSQWMASADSINIHVGSCSTLADNITRVIMHTSNSIFSKQHGYIGRLSCMLQRCSKLFYS